MSGPLRDGDPTRIGCTPASAGARVVAEGLAPGRLRYRPAMAVLGWFVPIGDLWLPKRIADDVRHASSPPGRGGAMAPAALLHGWWALPAGTRGGSAPCRRPRPPEVTACAAAPAPTGRRPPARSPARRTSRT
ncbi:DUF4328 domain-containing protein [[Actinomadura] parvosata]|uniref:DUF4328 domain-containing protein n=1 Tax=[Actinomadura] parvosata TaxID=1955412 RepID=UPI00406C36EE